MESSATRTALVAVDLGAQSCRVSLLHWDNGQPHINVIHRFPNAPMPTPAGLQWDIERILDGVQTGLAHSAQSSPLPIHSIAVDGWGVDYVRVDEDGRQIANPFCYRDERTILAEKEVHEILSPDKLYALTGIQLLRINTLYQLYADAKAGIDPKVRWISIPEFITHRLGGRLVSEYTNATHTQLVSWGSQKWCDEIFGAVGLDRSAAPDIVPTGTVVGKLRGDLSELSAFKDTRLVVPGCHDTASAIAAIPAMGDDWAFISSGTWSLVGAVLSRPCVSDEARRMNFTNLGGVGGSICFLKNVNGLWLLSQCLEEWDAQGHHFSLTDLLYQAASCPAPAQVIDVDDAQLMLPGNVPAKINAQLAALGQKPFSSGKSEIPAMVSLILHSLAARYAQVFSSLAEITGKKLKRLFIVGGGGQNALLNRLTADHTGLEVIAGSAEATTIGNFAVQLTVQQGAWLNSTGVVANGVARWADEISPRPMALSHARQTG